MTVNPNTYATDLANWPRAKSFQSLMYAPAFHRLWFLWLLMWLVAGFALIALIVERLRLRRPVPGTGGCQHPGDIDP